MIKFSAIALRSNNTLFVRSPVSESAFAAVCIIPEDHPLYMKSFSDFDPYTESLPSCKYDIKDSLTSIVRETVPEDSCIIILLNDDSSFIWSANYANNVAQQFAVNLSKINNYSNKVQDSISKRLYSFGLL